MPAVSLITRKQKEGSYKGDERNKKNHKKRKTFLNFKKNWNY